MRVIWLCLIALRWSCLAQSNYQLPANELSALVDLYQSTMGWNWDWNAPYDAVTGYPWNVSSTEIQEPCSSTMPWQGVHCSSDCMVSPCNVIGLDLQQRNLEGKLEMPES